MSKIFLIHGFAVGLTAPIFRCGFGISAGFRIFEDLILKKEAVVFRWGIDSRVNPFRFLNPFFLLNYYEDEKFLAQAFETHKRLEEFLEKEKPEVIVCHSMGCFLLNEYLKNNQLPSSVRTIVFNQADIAKNEEIKIELPVYNFYCPWDPTLIASSIYNRAWRGGLGQLKKENVKNVLFPLWCLPNLHVSAIRDERFVRHILTPNPLS